MNVKGQLCEPFPVERIKEHATLGADVKAVLNGQQGRDILVNAEFRNSIGLDLRTVVAAKAIVGAEPDKTVPILHDVTHRISQQPIIHRDVSVTVVVLGHDGHKTTDTDS